MLFIPKKHTHTNRMNGSLNFEPLKGTRGMMSDASRRRSSKRVGLQGQLAPHCVP